MSPEEYAVLVEGAGARRAAGEARAEDGASDKTITICVVSVSGPEVPPSTSHSHASRNGAVRS